MAQPHRPSQEFLTFVHRSKRFRTRATAAAQGVMRGVVKDAADVYEKKGHGKVSPSARATAVKHLLATASGLSAVGPHGAKRNAARPPRAGTAKRNSAGRFYEVLVSNIGSVYTGTDAEQAEADYDYYVRESKSGLGRAGKEDVTLMIDGEPDKEHQGRPTRRRTRR